MAVAPLTEGERLRRLINAPIVIGPLPGTQPAAAPAPPGAFDEFGRAFKATAVGRIASGFGQIAADLPGADQGNALQQYGQGVEERNASSIQGLQDIVDRPGAAFGAATGNAAGSVAGMVGARAVGSAITAAGGYLVPANPLIGGAVAGLGQLISWGGPMATLFAQSYGGIRQRQIEDNPEAAGGLGAKLAAGTGGVASAAVERLGGPEALTNILLRGGKGALAKEVGKEGAKQAAATTYGGALRNLVTGPVARTALRSSVTEAGGELLQNPIEQAAAFQNPLAPESLQETAFGAAMGLLGGAGVGGAFGALTPRGKPTVDPGAVSDDDLKGTVDGALSGPLLALPAPSPAPEQPFEVSSRGVVTRAGQLEQDLAQTDDIAERARLLGLGQQPVGQFAQILGSQYPGQLALPAPGQVSEAPILVSSRGVAGRPNEVEQALAQTDDTAERARILGLGPQEVPQPPAPPPPPFQQAISSLPTANLKGLPTKVRDTLAKSETPEALEEAVAREIYTRTKAGSTAQYVNNPDGPLQSLYRAVSGASIPSMEELAARFEPPVEQAAPVTQEAPVQAVAEPVDTTEALAPQTVPEQPAAVVPEQAPPVVTPATAALAPVPAKRGKKAAAKKAPAPADTAAPAPVQPVEPDLPAGLTTVESKERTDATARLRELESRADIATLRLMEDDGTMPDTLRRRHETEIAAFEQAQELFNKKYSPQLSRGVKTAGGTHTVESVLSDIKERVGAAISKALGKRFVVVQSVQDMHNDMRRRGSFNADAVQDGAKGVYDPSTGVSYIITENMAANDSAWGVLLHEMGVHYGLRKMLGDSGYESIFRDIGRFLSDGDAAFVAAARRVNIEESLGLDPDAPDFAQQMAERVAQDSRLGEEVLGYFAENPNNHNRSLWRRTVVAVRKFLRKAGFDLQLSTKDVMDIVHASTLGAVNEQTPSSQQQMEKDAQELLLDYGYRAVQNPDGTVDIVNGNGRVIADEDVPTPIQLAATILKYPGMSEQLLSDITQTGPLYSRSTARGQMGDAAATDMQGFGQAANAARAMKARVMSLLTGGKGGTISARMLGAVAKWADRNTLAELFDNRFGGALKRNAQTYANQEVIAARFGQLFSNTYKKLERQERTDPAAYKAISKLMQATELRLDHRKTWAEHTHLQGESAEDQAMLKSRLAELKQAWGKLNPEQRGVYTDLVTMNETTYFADMAVTLQNMVASEPLDAATKAVFAGDASEAFRNDPATHENVAAAHKYWKGVLDKYTTALNTHTATERAKLPVREPTTPEDKAAIAAAMKGVTDPAQRKRIKRMLLAGRQAGLTPEQRAMTKHLNSLDAQLEMTQRSLKSIAESPYFHLGRFGNYFVGLTVRRDAEGKADPAAMQQVVERLTKDFPTVSLRADSGNPKIFTRFESSESAQAFVNALDKLSADGLLDTTEDSAGYFKGSKSEVVQRPVGPAWLSRVIENIREDDSDPDTTNTMVESLRAMYLESLPERSVARVMAHRKGVQGYSTDMIRSYAHRMYIAASHIAGLATAPARQDTFREMQDVLFKAQADPNIDVDGENKLRIIVDELKQRDLDNADLTPQSPAMSVLRALGHAYFLGLSPAYVMMNIMQVGTHGAPELAKRFGAAKSTAAVGAAFPDALKVVTAAIREGYKSGGTTGAAEMVITSDVLAAGGLSPERVKYLVEMMGTGKLDIGTIARNIGRVAEGEVSGEGGAKLNTALKIATSFTLMSEILARTTMALAAYDLHGKDGAVQYAARVIDNSMLNYNATNIGRQTGTKGIIGGLTPTALQFHQFAFQTLGKLVTETYRAFANSPGVDETQRAEARTFLKGHVTAMMLLAGTMGLPFMTVAARLSDMLCEMFGDTPCDTKASLRNFTSDVFGADIEPIISRGILRSVGGDLSNRIGEADLLPFSRFLADRRTLDEKLKTPVLSISGASGGMVSNIVKGAQKISDGDLWGGIQSIVPVALQGPLKAYSLSKYGFTDSNSGLTLPMTPTVGDKLMRTLGIQPGVEADYAQAKQTQRQRTSILTRELAVIRKNIVKAIEQQDRDELLTWGRKAAEFQQSNPGVDIMTGVRSSLQQRQRATALSSVGILPGSNIRDVGIQNTTRFFQPGVQ